MKVKILASGSKANCTLIRTTTTNILIDMGVTYQYLTSELAKMNLTPNDIDAIMITHTHSDHIKGLASLVKKTNIKVYILEEMIPELAKKLPLDNYCLYKKQFNLSELSIQIIRISHNAEGVGFILEENNHSLVYITDTGYINRKYFSYMKNKNIYIIKSNHDEKMLMEGPYPYILKQRIISDKGHLSNHTTAEYLSELVGPTTKKIILAHISEKNNSEELALNTTKNLLTENNLCKDVLIAKQYEPLEEIEV